MSSIWPTDKVWKKDPDKLLGNSEETTPLFLDRASRHPAFLSSSLRSALPTALSQHQFRGLSKYKWEGSWVRAKQG